MSRRFWIYWAFVVPLTLATLGTWALWGGNGVARIVWRQIAQFVRHGTARSAAPTTPTAAGGRGGTGRSTGVDGHVADGTAAGAAAAFPLRSRSGTRSFRQYARVDTRAGDNALPV